MAVQISGDKPSSEDEIDPQFVASAFAEQYYFLLEKSPTLVHKFYNDQSTLNRLGPDGEMVSMTTIDRINGEIMSSHYKGCSFERINLDAQASLMGGVLVAVNGNIIGKDDLKKGFTQTFFLAKQPKGYFVLNDILRFTEVLEPEILPTSNGTKKNASNISFTCDQETPAQSKEVIDGGEELSGMRSGEKASDVETNNKLSDAETGKKLTNTETGMKESNLDSGKGASDIDIGKKTDSDEKPDSDMRGTVAEAPNSSLNGSENKPTLTYVASNDKQETTKTSYASMVAKEGKVTSPTKNTGYKVVRVAPNADQQAITRATPKDAGIMANSAKKEHIASNVTKENNNANADALAPRSIYIANLPWNITKYGLVDALKIFGCVRPGGVQIKMCEDGFCFGFVEFESASSASKAVEVHNITLGENEAYIMYKKSGGSRSGNDGGNGGSRNSNSKGRDTHEMHGNNGSYGDNNQADRKRMWGFVGRNGETNQNSHDRVGRAYSKSRQSSNERPYIDEARRKNIQTKR